MSDKPQLRPGDVIEYDDLRRVLFAVDSDGDYVKYLDPNGEHNGWRLKYLFARPDFKAVRRGVQIWPLPEPKKLTNREIAIRIYHSSVIGADAYAEILDIVDQKIKEAGK